MALTRKFLKALGIEDEKADQIIEEHTGTVNRLTEENSRLKTEADKLPGVQKELNDLREAAEKNGKDPFKVKYEAVREEFEKFKTDLAKEKTKTAKSAALTALMKELGVSERIIGKAVEISNLDSIELDEGGKIKDADKLKESVKQEWGEFIVTTGARGADVGTPPAGGGTPDYDSMSDADYYKATYEAAKNKH